MHKRDGKEYEPTSLAAMQASIDKYLRESHYECSILTSRYFKESRNVFEGNILKYIYILVYCVHRGRAKKKAKKTMKYAVLQKVKKILCGNKVN